MPALSIEASNPMSDDVMKDEDAAVAVMLRALGVAADPDSIRMIGQSARAARAAVTAPGLTPPPGALFDTEPATHAAALAALAP